MTTTITLDLHVFRNILFDIGGSDKEYVECHYVKGKDIAALDPDEFYFHYEEETNLLWQTKAWKASSEKHARDKEASAQRIKQWNLKGKLQEAFAIKLWNGMRIPKEQGRAVCGALIMKKNWKKIKEIVGEEEFESKYKDII